MRRGQLRVLAGVAIVLNLVGVALTIGRRPPGPWTDLDCTIWYVVAQFLILSAYFACLLYCSREHQEESDKYRCFDQCGRWLIYSWIAIVLAYILCSMGVFS